MNIQELLEEAKNLELNTDKDLAAEPADMEKDDTKEIKIVEPEIDTKELLKKLEDFDLSVLDAIKEQDPEAQFEMIDNKQPLKEDVASDANGYLWDACAEMGYQKIEELAKKYKSAQEIFDIVGIEVSQEVIDYAQEILDICCLNESVDTVVAKYESTDGKHEIIRTAEGLYRNRYFLKEDGKARRMTRGVKTLPTAVGALMKRFPEAKEIK